MIDKMLALVERFNREIVGMAIPEKPKLLDGTNFDDRFKHLHEELEELQDATTVADQADALLDLVYVALGGLLLMGVTPGAAFEEVHDANMRRVKTEQPNGKLGVVKPEGWKPPDLEPLLRLTREDLQEALIRKESKDHVSLRRVPRYEFPDRAVMPTQPATFCAGQPASTEEAAMAKKRAKVNLTMVPTEFLNPTAQTFMFGAEKYSTDGYKKNDYKFSELVAALMRHAREFMDGKDLDLHPETAQADKWGPGSTYSGLPIIGNMGCCVAMLAWRFRHKYKESDDRFYSPDYDGRFRVQNR